MTSLRGFGWKRFFTKLQEKSDETDLFNRAAQVGFYFSFAFFPLLLFLMTLFGLVLNQTESLQGELYSYLARIMPTSAFVLVRTTMAEIIDNSSGGKLTLGIIATLWSASAGIDSLRAAMNSVYEVDETSRWWKRKLQSLLFTFLFIMLIAVALTIITAGVKLAETAAGESDVVKWAVILLQWLFLLGVLLFTTAAIYNWLPSFEKFRWVWVTPGAMVAIVLWGLLTAAFKTYLHYFNSYNKAYGSLGAVIILMLWMYLTGLALLVGGAINSVLTEMSPSSGAEEAQEHELEHRIREEKKDQTKKGKRK
ncbi:MAG: YihY/virulence factor BrkB family protein [Acidobacteria bacterium]|nr:YihY/virulence factor BrkB family protein [Acidobacteriota bacterium]